MKTQDYEIFVERWIDGITNELQYWDEYIRTKAFGNQKEFNEYTAIERDFLLEDDLSGDETKFIDVGSGPFSICGTKTNKTRLEFVAVDMLAPVYDLIKKKYDLVTEVEPEFALFDNLFEIYGKDQFDIVHMSNALDHTFDPMFAIWQMISICKVGGKVILQHHQNEAEAAKYDGLHQWNCTLEHGFFEIWNKEDRINVEKELEGICDVYKERHAPMDKIVLTKKKEIKVAASPYRYIFEKMIVQKLSALLADHYYGKVQ